MRLNPRVDAGVAATLLAGRGGGVGYRGDMVASPDDGAQADAAAWADCVACPQRLGWIYDRSGGISSSDAWQSSTSGAGATETLDTDATRLYRVVSTGTTTIGRASRNTTPAQAWIIFSNSGYTHRYQSRFRVPILSDATETHAIRLGFVDSVTGASTDGVHLELDANTDAQFQCVARAASTETRTDSGITAVAATWYNVEIVVTLDDSSDFYIWAEGSAKPSSPTVTIVTNVPSGTAQGTSIGGNINKSAGTTSRDLELEYQVASQDRMAA